MEGLGNGKDLCPVERDPLRCTEDAKSEDLLLPIPLLPRRQLAKDLM